jgi:PPOX class probable F420-dependent enzyme
MDLGNARTILADQHRAVLATMREDGTPQMSPVLVTVDDVGRAVISTRQAAYKVRNIRRDHRVWLCVLPDQFFGDWIQVEGNAEVIGLPDAMDGGQTRLDRLRNVGVAPVSAFVVGMIMANIWELPLLKLRDRWFPSDRAERKAPLELRQPMPQVAA